MIDLIDISKTFTVKKQQTHALDHVSLQVQDGDIFGVIGFSGAGKSTLLRMVNGLETPTGGRVKVDGQDIQWAKDIAAAYHSDEFKAYMKANNKGLWYVPKESQ